MKLSDLLTNTTTERDRLKPAFNLGEIPTSQDFHDMIDGLFLIQGNTLYKDDSQGLSIQAGSDTAKSVLLFYDDPAQEPAWSWGIQNGFHLKNNSDQTYFSVLPEGKVGIGTTNPTEQLQIVGNTSVYDGNLTFNSSTLNQASMGVLRWNEYPDNQTTFAGAFMQFNGQENFFQLFTNDETNDYEHLRVYRNGHLALQPQGIGNVGIGTTNPTEQLQIVGNASLYDGNLTFNSSTFNQVDAGILRWNEYPDNGTSLSGAFIKYNGANNLFQIFTNDETNDYEHLRIYEGGHLALQPQGSSNVGIGTTNPTYKLQVEGDIFANGGLRTTSGLYFESGGGWYMSDSSWIRSFGGKNIYHNTGVMRTDGRLEVGESGRTFAATNGGNVGINNPNPTYPLEVNGHVRINNTNNTTGGQSGHLYFHSTQGDFARIYSEQVYENRIQMVIEVGDDANQDSIVLRSHAWGQGGFDILEAFHSVVKIRGKLEYQTIQQVSDERFKQNITPLDAQQVDKLYQLQGTKYQFRTEEFKERGFAEGNYLGFLAQEVQALYPELVSEDEEGYLSINYVGLIPIIVEANKQQQKRIEALEAQLASFINS
ncbi:MAG TPA: hypothetical protein DCS93_07275 [Microscillaceae bacterium]|nr:hypothetical protein [Microscillaceae bacterium]